MSSEDLLGSCSAVPVGLALPVEEHEAYDEAILRVVRDDEAVQELPLVTNVDPGDTYICTVPRGTRMRIDPAEATLTFLEPGVL